MIKYCRVCTKKNYCTIKDSITSNECKEFSSIDAFFNSGREDNSMGVDIEECPYDDGTDGEYGWKLGWDYEDKLGHTD